MAVDLFGVVVLHPFAAAYDIPFCFHRFLACLPYTHSHTNRTNSRAGVPLVISCQIFNSLELKLSFHSAALHCVVLMRSCYVPHY